MTRDLSPFELAPLVQRELPSAAVSPTTPALMVEPGSLLAVARLLQESPTLKLDYLVSVTGVDYLDYLEVVYHLASIALNHRVVLKVQLPRGDKPTVPSLTSLWRGADLQEREVYDLMGVYFEGHPNLKRVFLWEGFVGHPLRKDFLY
ncbi:MAG: NADH-quinone oxidoreductase subunit C [Chloroflexi bacterium]|nr:NADH-quinone oxidoreductase subunit C [Chloroflexota bacterium]